MALLEGDLQGSELSIGFCGNIHSRSRQQLTDHLHMATIMGGYPGTLFQLLRSAQEIPHSSSTFLLDLAIKESPRLIPGVGLRPLKCCFLRACT